MLRGVAGLSEREREVLRLLLRGHDAKSAARELDLSVHTVNEHLREARRKLEVSSSREAARMLAEQEQLGPNSSGDEELGVGRRTAPVASHRLNWFGGGMLTMSLLVAAALASAFHSESKPKPDEPPEVVATNPKQGATIKPGRFYVSVTYDRRMMAGSASFAGPPELAPQPCGAPEQSKDGKTYRMCFVASAARHYEIWFNREPYMNFRSAEGVSASPYRLAFSVSR